MLCVAWESSNASALVWALPIRMIILQVLCIQLKGSEHDVRHGLTGVHYLLSRKDLASIGDSLLPSPGTQLCLAVS